MFTDTINKCAANAARIVRLNKDNPFGFWISSAMAGAYVGLGIILIFTLGNMVEPALRPLLMGATFGIALTLVIIAGSELFTGHTMFLTLGVKAGTISGGQWLAILPQTWLGNLIGSIFVAVLYYYGGGNLLPVDSSLVHTAALAKTTAPAAVLFFKGALCNWLVCLAIWMALRTEGAGKFLAIWWCLLAFIASGYEHSVANMTLFALSWLGNHSESFTLSGIGHNLLWVTLGNTLSGAVFMGLGYWYATPRAQRPVTEATAQKIRLLNDFMAHRSGGALFLPKQISVVRIVGWTIYRFFVNCSKKPACWSAVAKSLNARHDC